MVTCVPGNKRCTASAMTWAAEWRSTARPSGSLERIEDLPSGTDGNYVVGELSALLEELTRRQARWPRGLRHAHALVELATRAALDAGEIRERTPEYVVGAGGIEPSTPTVSR